MFLIQLKSIHNRHQKSCTTLCQLFENLILRSLHLILYKNRRFVIYMEKYVWAKIKKEIDKLISSSSLKKKATDISPESFKSFLYVKVGKEYRRHASFTQSLICTYVDSSKIIIKDPDSIDLYGILSLCNNMTKPPLLENWTTLQHNCILIAVVALGILCYV